MRLLACLLAGGLRLLRALCNDFGVLRRLRSYSDRRHLVHRDNT
jgi:hypothetical protein